MKIIFLSIKILFTILVLGNFGFVILVMAANAKEPWEPFTTLLGLLLIFLFSCTFLAVFWGDRE